MITFLSLLHYALVVFLNTISILSAVKKHKGDLGAGAKSIAIKLPDQTEESAPKQFYAFSLKEEHSELRLKWPKWVFLTFYGCSA